MNCAQLRQFVQHVESKRNKRMPVWRELSHFMLPSRGSFPGEEQENLRNRHRFNKAAYRALRKSAAGLTDGMTPSSLPWFRHDYIRREQREVTGAREYADMVDEILMSILSAGGFYPAIHSFNTELLAFGCALLYEEQSYKSLVRFFCPTVGTYAVALDEEQELSVVVHRMQFPAKALVERFGAGSVSERVRKLVETRPYEDVEVVHVVMPRRGTDRGKIDNLSMPWASYWYEAEGTASDGLLSVSGYNEMPYFFTTWNEARGLYGVGPGDEALSDQKALEACELYKTMGLEKTIDPPVVAPSMLKGKVQKNPGGVTISNMQGAALTPLYQINFGAALPYVQQEIQNISQRLEDSLLSSVFASISMDQRPAQMSATEFMARKREATQQMGPAMSAYEPRVLNKVLERTFAIAERMGYMPMPPEDLGEQFSLDVQYIGPTAQALRQTGADTTRQLISDVLPLAQLQPDVLDKLDLDQAVDELARGIAAPGSVVRSDDDVAAMRQQRAQQQAAQQAQEMQLAQQQQMIDLAKVPTENTMGGKAMGMSSE